MDEVPVRVVGPGVSGLDEAQRAARRQLPRTVGPLPTGELVHRRSMGRPRAWWPERVDALRLSYLKHGREAAAKEFGISPSRVVHVLAAHGKSVKYRGQHGPPKA